MRKLTVYSWPLCVLIASGCGDDSSSSDNDNTSNDSGYPGYDSSTPVTPTTIPTPTITPVPTGSNTSPVPIVDAGGPGPSTGSEDASVGDAGERDASAALDAGSALDGSIEDASVDAGDADAADAAPFPPAAQLEYASLPEGFTAWHWARGIDDPRGIAVDSAGTVLVVSRQNSSVVALWDDNGDGVSGTNERATIGSAPGIQHGIALNGGYLYVSSSSTVYRFVYDPDHNDLGSGIAVVTGIPEGGQHSSRTLLFDDTFFYVSVGSATNVDEGPGRSAIRRFPINELDSSTPLDFESGELFADGLRNEVGLALDGNNQVWGVENGRDDLQRTDLGGDIHLRNPGEELNLFSEPGLFYGYPYCWSEGDLGDAGLGAGTQWADPDNTTHNDDWCRDPENVVPPQLVLQAHTAPLDILFYKSGNFPSGYVGDAIITLHGSWNRPVDDAVGYKVVRVPFGANGLPSGSAETLLEYNGEGDRPVGDAAIASQWPIRPVALAELADGTLLVTSDESNEIIAIAYRP